MSRNNRPEEVEILRYNGFVLSVLGAGYLIKGPGINEFNPYLYNAVKTICDSMVANSIVKIPNNDELYSEHIIECIKSTYEQVLKKLADTVIDQYLSRDRLMDEIIQMKRDGLFGDTKTS